jgi:hypothetical protein
VRVAKVELEHADFAPGFIENRIELDLRMLDDCGEMRVVEDQPRKPEPRRTDQAEQFAVMLRLRDLDPAQ